MIRPLSNGRVLMVMILTIVTSSCWIPENFDAVITINKDGSYTFAYNGTITFAPALAAAKEGELSPNDERDIQQEAAPIRQEPGFKRVDYEGKGRFRVVVERSLRAGEPFYFISKDSQFFAVVPHPDHTITVSPIRPSADDLQQLNSIGAKMDGTLSVSVASSVTVLKQNADTQPYFFGLFGAYKWQIKSPAASPMIVVQL